MAYNEQAYLPIWARHYARQVGADHCYVVDHGSTDTVKLPPGVRLDNAPEGKTISALLESGDIDGFIEAYLRMKLAKGGTDLAKA